MSLVSWEGYFRHIPMESWRVISAPVNSVIVFNRLLNTYRFMSPCYAGIATPRRLELLADLNVYF